MANKLENKGFGLLTTLICLLVAIIVALAGWYIWNADHKRSTQKNATTTSYSNYKSSNSKKAQEQTADPYSGWKSYTDTGYSEASGITVKYPSDWHIKVGGFNAFAWEIIHTASPNESVTVREVLLSASTTPQQEWDNCPSADACGPAPGSTKLEATNSTVNGLYSYGVKMRSSTGTIYYATVIKGNKTTSNGTVFVEFEINNPSSATLNIYKQIIASANFSN